MPKSYWKKKDRSSDTYFSKQLKQPKISTIEFFKFLKKNKFLNSRILDLACGSGGNLIYLFKKHHHAKECLGIDFNKDLIKKAIFNSKKIKNLNFTSGNILKTNKKLKNKYDGIISLQVLSVLSDYNLAVNQMTKLNPKFIAVSSLFWEGLTDYNIKVNNLVNSSHKRKVDNFTFYNIYSLKNYINLMKKKGYKKNIFMKFDIKKKLPEPKDKTKMLTYTIKYRKKNLQLSGPILMNWYFIISSKK